jgi:hypothetical protein
MDENQTIAEITRLRNQAEESINTLLNSRGFYRTAEPQTTSAGIALWVALSPEQKDKYEKAARGTGIPGPGLFFKGYREETG